MYTFSSLIHIQSLFPFNYGKDYTLICIRKLKVIIFISTFHIFLKNQAL